MSYLFIPPEKQPYITAYGYNADQITVLKSNLAVQRSYL